MFNYKNRENEFSVKSVVKWIVIVIVTMVVIVMFIKGFFYSIDPGHRGVLVTLGKVEQKSYVNGVGVKWPFVSSMVEMDVRTKKMTEKTSTYTSDVQTAEM